MKIRPLHVWKLGLDVRGSRVPAAAPGAAEGSAGQGDGTVFGASGADEVLRLGHQNISYTCYVYKYIHMHVYIYIYKYTYLCSCTYI